MGIRLPFLVLQAKQIFKSTSTPQFHSGSKQSNNVPKGHIAVYVGELQKKRFVVPISYLNHPTFLDLLNRVEEEFGYNHPMGGLTIPCKEDAFINITSQLRALWKINSYIIIYTRLEIKNKTYCVIIYRLLSFPSFFQFSFLFSHLYGFFILALVLTNTKWCNLLYNFFVGLVICF